MDEKVEYWKQKFERERASREEAETTLEKKNLELSNLNQTLQKRVDDVTNDLSFTLDTLNEHVIMSKTDKKGIITDVSDAFCKIAGYSKSELIGKPHSIVRHPDTPKSTMEGLWSNLKSNKAWYGEIKNRKRDGSTYWVSAIISPNIDMDNNIIGYISVRQDITNSHKLKEQEEHLISQMRHAAMGEMIGMIAHQWRQPLAAISSTSIDMKMQSEFENFDLQLKEEAQKYEAYINNGLDEINELVQNLTTTIDDFRNFFKPNKELITVKLENVITKSLKIIKASILGDNIELIEEHKSKEEVELYDNEMMQVILNILKNAQDNFKEKSIKNPYIKIAVVDRTISICDNGGGIPEHIIYNIFEPYFSTKDEKNGTGLGLYMSKTIVEDHHNGKLSAENRDDGVCFTIELNSELSNV